MHGLESPFGLINNGQLSHQGFNGSGVVNRMTNCTIVGTLISDPCARTLELPLLVRPGVFFFFFCLVGAGFRVLFAPFPEEEISDYLVVYKDHLLFEFLRYTTHELR